MKRGLRLFSKILVAFCLMVILLPLQAEARGPLDEIQNYTIQVDMRPDGTMDIRYHIEWKVLDDTSEGPLSWVKIGNPNMHVDEITALSDNIQDIRYLAEDGSYIRIDFDREYHENEIIIFEYSIHQSYMYVIEEEEHICRYSFTPGWFDEIEVKEIKILWNRDNVLESTAQGTEGNYLVWSGSLEMGERLNASVQYNLDVFTTNEEEQYTEESGSEGGISPFGLLIAAGIVILVIIVLCALFVSDDDDYDSHGGFGGSHYYHTMYVHTRSSCACACVSCACACACAGGGRAGCSKKDFYGTNLRIKDLEKVLKEHKK